MDEQMDDESSDVSYHNWLQNVEAGTTLAAVMSFIKVKYYISSQS